MSIYIDEILKEGLDDRANEQTFSMNVWNDSLYFGTRNKKRGSRVYSLDKQGNLSICLIMDKENVDTYGLVGFHGHLLVGTYNEKGGELYRWRPGDEAEKIFGKGLDDSSNRDIWSFTIYMDKLYFGTWNTLGGKLYKTDDAKCFDLVMDTLDPGRDYIRCLTVYDDRLFASFGRRDQECRLLFIDRDGKIHDVVTPMEKPRSDIYEMRVFNDWLYLAVSAYHRDQEIGGCEIWRYDGNIFEKVVSRGFGNNNNIYIFSLEVHRGRLYAATYNYKQGTELWSSHDGETWSCDSAGGYGRGSKNECVIHSLKSWGGALYAGTRNSSEGFCLYRLVREE